jgi:hypothetical protein
MYKEKINNLSSEWSIRNGLFLGPNLHTSALCRYSVLRLRRSCNKFVIKIKFHSLSLLGHFERNLQWFHVYSYTFSLNRNFEKLAKCEMI